VLLTLRIIVPPDRTEAVRRLFEDDPGTAHLAVLPGACLRPAGDLVLADVARESADALIGELRRLGVDRDGGISVETIDAAVSRRAEEAEKAAPGEASDAVVWEQVVRTVAGDSTLSVAYLAFFTIATVIAAIGVINDSAILVIGAMVLGPEFAPLAGVALGLVQRRRGLLRRAAITLVVGFVVAIAVAALAGLAGRALGWFGPELLTAERPQTGFITSPDRWSLVVAVLAGVAGVLSLTSAKTGALVGVFISVTTVPAAGAMALGLSLGSSSAFGEAGTQLGINLAGLLLAAIGTLLLQKAVWRRVPGRVPRAVRYTAAD
jgi:uncharacterized hydrophobic protein (TIGR00271 family)